MDDRGYKMQRNAVINLNLAETPQRMGERRGSITLFDPSEAVTLSFDLRIFTGLVGRKSPSVGERLVGRPPLLAGLIRVVRNQREWTRLLLIPHLTGGCDTKSQSNFRLSCRE